jgi:hypothetical protein
VGSGLFEGAREDDQEGKKEYAQQVAHPRTLPAADLSFAPASSAASLANDDDAASTACLIHTNELPRQTTG